MCTCMTLHVRTSLLLQLFNCRLAGWLIAAAARSDVNIRMNYYVMEANNKPLVLYTYQQPRALGHVRDFIALSDVY